MRRFLQHLFLVYTSATIVSANFLGPRFPAPVHFANNDSLISSGWRNFTGVLNEYLSGNREASPKLLAGLENLTFSAGMFSIHDLTAQSLQYHYTSDEVKKGPGVKQVDGNSIYRVASISKLFTVFAGMLEFEEEQWDQPITNFVSATERESLKNVGVDLVNNIQWKKVTLRALASQISGIPRDSQPWTPAEILLLPDLTTGKYPSNPEASGRPPNFQPWSTPAYVDNGFILLGIALANITGKPIAQVYPDAIFGPLGMNNSKTVVPPNSTWSQYVIPETGVDQWALPGGLSISSGGLFSSLNDLGKFATALMNSTLLPADKTRRWIKPVSHTASLNFSVGAPWEIYRYTNEKTGAISDIYTKLGDSGDYTGFVALIPDYDAGFNIICSSTNTSQKSILASTIADLITATIIPAMEAQAAAESKCNFAGTYQSRTQGLNSSLTLTLNESATDPSLRITSWISNSTDMISLLPTFFGTSEVKLQPSIIEPGKAAFLALPVHPKSPPGSFLGPFLEMATDNEDWLIGEGLTYGGVSLSLFVFDVGPDGKALTASPVATRATLERVA
ncbi:beta-lactamase family protein [Halenospora varia]|nr:beta-lactamase family protein [Halenospora varia]